MTQKSQPTPSSHHLQKVIIAGMLHSLVRTFEAPAKIRLGLHSSSLVATRPIGCSRMIASLRQPGVVVSGILWIAQSTSPDGDLIVDGLYCSSAGREGLAHDARIIPRQINTRMF
jgi:hypothetical protein